ncbi:MAG: PCYCGC domain-containing protein [Chloroflexi bacterium]|nr:PCYCGC domain-containing protein [Chloroflexota bacterium]
MQSRLRSKQRSKQHLLVLVAPLLILLSAATAGCGVMPNPSADEPAMASMADMPAEVKTAPVLVQQAYQFAVANPDVLQKLPCYCGCGAMGHRSNYDCYVKAVDSAGKVTYDSHALGCSICVDITQDAMRLLKQGKGVQEIRAYVDATYSRYGPSNMPQ